MHDENYLDELVRNSAGPKYSSFNDLYLHLYPQLIRYVKKFLWYNNGYAEDAVSETFLKAIERIDQFIPKTNITNWFFRIARNTALDFKKKQKYRNNPIKETDLCYCVPESKPLEGHIIGNLYLDSVFAHLQENVKPLFLEPVTMLCQEFKY